MVNRELESREENGEWNRDGEERENGVIQIEYEEIRNFDIRNDKREIATFF